VIAPQSLLLSAFLGDNQGQSVLQLAEFYSSGGSVNLYIDKIGQIRTVDGWLRQNAAAYTTETGGTASKIPGMYLYRKIAGGTTTRQLLFVLDDGVNEWELHYSTDLGATKTFIADLGSGSVGRIPDFATFGDQLYIANGVIQPRYWDGTALANTGVTQLGAPTLTDAGAGALNGAGYKYRLVPIRANKERKPGSSPSAALDVQNRRITVSWTADTDVTVVGYELYRTTGSGLDFYLVSYIDGRTTATYVGDTLPDKDLITRPALSVIASHGDPPPEGIYFCVPHKGRMWWGRTDTDPRRWYWSDPGDADSVYTDRSYLDLTDSKSLGDVSTGGTGDFENMLVLWCLNSVWTVSGTGIIVGSEIDWRKRRQNCDTGTVSHRTAVRVPKGAVYTDQEGRLQRVERSSLARLTPQKDLRLFDGQGDTIFSFAKQDTLARLNTTHQTKSYAYHDEAHKMFVWVFPADNDTEPSLSVAWNYAYGTMHEWTGTNFAHVAVAESASAVSVLLAGESRTGTGGFIYKLWTGDNRDGSDITATFMSKPVYPPIEPGGTPDLSHEKRLNNLFLLFAKDAVPTSVSVGFLAHDADDTDAVEFDRTVSATTRIKVPCRQQSTDSNPGQFFHGVGFRVKITSTGTSGPWTLKGIEITYQVLEGQTR